MRLIPWFLYVRADARADACADARAVATPDTHAYASPVAAAWVPFEIGDSLRCGLSGRRTLPRGRRCGRERRYRLPVASLAREQRPRRERGGRTRARLASFPMSN